MSIPGLEPEFSEHTPEQQRQMVALVSPAFDTVGLVHDILSHLDSALECEEKEGLREVKLVHVYGRCLAFKYTVPCGPLATWAQLAPLLMGVGKPLEDFRIYKTGVFCVLKTAAQIGAGRAAAMMDRATADIDDSQGPQGKVLQMLQEDLKHWEPSEEENFILSPTLDMGRNAHGTDFAQFCLMVAQGGLPKPATETPTTEAVKPVQGLKDLPLLLYRIVQNKSPIGVDEILDVAREKMRKSRKDAIKDRRRERAAKSLDTLIASGALNLSDDGAEVSL